MPAELRKRESIEPIDQYRVEDAGQYTDAELAGLLKDIFGLMDVPGTVKKLKAKELYFLAFGAAKKGVAHLPAMSPKSVAPPPSVARAGGAATGAIPAKQDDEWHPDAREYAEMKRKTAYAREHPVDPYSTTPNPDDVTPESEKRERLAEKENYSPNNRPPLPPFNGKTTEAAFVPDDGGKVVYFTSGKPDPRYANYASAGHTEGKAAIYMRDNGIQSGTLYHNNTNGTCGFCHSFTPTLLPTGAILKVYPPPNAVANNPQAKAGPTTYIGNNSQPSPNKR